MSDKTIILIFCVINIFMWIFVWDYMIRTKRQDAEMLKKVMETSRKSDSYMHTVHENMAQMTEMNVKAMSHFLEQLSVNIIDRGQTGEAENRE